MGPDAVRLLCRTITMTTPGEVFFLTGLRGSGKTVQLLRLKQDLQRRGFAVVMFSAEDYLNMHEPLNVVDVLFFLVGGDIGAWPTNSTLRKPNVTFRSASSGWGTLPAILVIRSPPPPTTSRPWTSVGVWSSSSALRAPCKTCGRGSQVLPGPRRNRAMPMPLRH